MKKSPRNDERILLNSFDSAAAAAIISPPYSTKQIKYYRIAHSTRQKQ
jgi:hypothetical protein